MQRQMCSLRFINEGSTVEMALSKILLPPFLLEESPSRRDLISAHDEELHRVYGCELIQEASILLRLPQVCAVTGQNIFHRYFYRKSFKRFDAFTVAMGCVLLASKIEESAKNLREVIFVFHHIFQMRRQLKYKNLELGTERYSQWKSELITIERYILKELGFALYSISEHPHKYILYYVKVLGGETDIKEITQLSQMAWNYLNDSMRLDICLRYESNAIACAALYMSARKLEYPLPLEGTWMKVFGTNLPTTIEIASRIVKLYTYKKLTWLDPIAEGEAIEHLKLTEFDDIRPAAAASVEESDVQATSEPVEGSWEATPPRKERNEIIENIVDRPKGLDRQIKSLSKTRSRSRSTSRTRSRTTSRSKSRSRSRDRRCGRYRSKKERRDKPNDRDNSAYRRRSRSRSKNSDRDKGYRRSRSRSRNSERHRDDRDRYRDRDRSKYRR